MAIGIDPYSAQPDPFANLRDPLLDEQYPAHRPIDIIQWIDRQINQRVYMAAQMRAQAGKPVVPPDQAIAGMTAIQWKKMARDVLMETRPIEATFVENNIGIRMTNNDIVAISPHTDEQPLPDNHSIGVTQGRGRPGEMIRGVGGAGDGAIGVH